MVEPAIIFAQSLIPQIQQLGENMYFDMLQAEYEQTQTFERVEYFTIDTVRFSLGVELHCRRNASLACSSSTPMTLG